jgi:hypothetical protein
VKVLHLLWESLNKLSDRQTQVRRSFYGNGHGSGVILGGILAGLRKPLSRPFPVDLLLEF